MAIDRMLLAPNRERGGLPAGWTWSADRDLGPGRKAGLKTPIARSDPVLTSGSVTCHERLGGLLREYSRAPVAAAV